MSERNILLDILKGGAIVAVILYHLGVMPYGYLGVEFFLVVSGYLTTKSLIELVDRHSVLNGYWLFINGRLVRLWPLILLISALSLGFGWMWMLPIHYKLNCESVIGSCTFLNNFVQLITTGNYWTSTNDYKPLMHTWYVGILFQFYAFYPLVFILNKKLTKSWKYSSFVTLAIIFIISLALFLSPILSTAQNFYLLPSRLFEFTAGGLVALYTKIQDEENSKKSKGVLMFLAIALVAMLLSNYTIASEKNRLLVTVIVSTIFVLMVERKYNFSVLRWLKPLAWAGTASYSLYLFHQVLFAFYRYVVADVFSPGICVFLFACSLLIGFVAYYLLEKPLSIFIRDNKTRIYRVNIICAVFVTILSSVSLFYYQKQGMVRDIPELEMFVGENSETPEEYNGRAHAYNKDFVVNGKKNILVIGDSFGRDWINVLLESGVDSIMNISYCIEPNEITISRIKKADYVFIANNTYMLDRYERLLPLALTKKFYRVGRKSYGTWIGIIYNNDRYGNFYYNQLVAESASTIKTNTIEREMYGERFIDMMTPLKNDDGLIPIFDDKERLITQDGIHLTRAGAQKYAKILNIKDLLK